MVATYLAGDRVGAWGLFLASADIEMPAEVFEMVFGGPTEGRPAEDERFSFDHMELPTTFWQPDLAALERGAAGLVVAVGRGLHGSAVRPRLPRAGRRRRGRRHAVPRRPHRLRWGPGRLRGPTAARSWPTADRDHQMATRPMLFAWPSRQR